MENKIKDKIKNWISGDSKKIKIIFAVGMIGLVLILVSDFIPDEDSNKNENEAKISYCEYTDRLEKKLENVISSISGVGACNVMITLENTSESVYATNYETKNDDKSLSQKDEYVIYDSSAGETPVLIKEYMPQVQGVAVVCSGGDDVSVKEKIISSVTSLFNIPANRVSVSKIKQ